MTTREFPDISFRLFHLINSRSHCLVLNAQQVISRYQFSSIPPDQLVISLFGIKGPQFFFL